ncbi:MAG TPA: hypothetical protein VGZ32_08605 [Actinocrinis sp.]|uniref:hypothetical protein n=1 Tax=Actinocrinis sp. TaxID=1920516 RepID=UPI002DDD2E21|nr:hypothetical protein [Actinocrinis sp.]HEV3170385.1 hypothetical protein [Actinocrinis sp.]
MTAGFVTTAPVYYSGHPACCKVDDLRDALFTTTREAIVKLPIRLGTDTLCSLTVTMACPIWTPLGEYDDPDVETLPDWYVEGDNPTPTEQFGKKVRVYFIGHPSGTFDQVYIQTISDEEPSLIARR